MRIALFVCLAILVLVLVGLAIYLSIGYYCYRKVLARRGGFKRKIEIKNNLELEIDDSPIKYFKEGFVKISIVSNDDLSLKGFYKDNGKNKLALLMHGYGGSHFEISKYAQLFEARGYDILAIDSRAHGESEGDFLTMGLYESYDLKAWIEKILQIRPEYKIVLFGISMGASSTCMALGEKLPNSVVAAISDCGFSSADAQLSYLFKKTHFGSCYKIFCSFVKKNKNLDIKKISAVDKLKKSQVPVLFFHGACDDFVPTRMVHLLYDSVPESRRQLCIIQGACHTKSLATDEKQYKKEFNKFLDKYLM